MEWLHLEPMPIGLRVALTALGRWFARRATVKVH